MSFDLSQPLHVGVPAEPRVPLVRLPPLGPGCDAGLGIQHLTIGIYTAS